MNDFQSTCILSSLVTGVSGWWLKGNVLHFNCMIFHSFRGRWLSEANFVQGWGSSLYRLLYSITYRADIDRCLFWLRQKYPINKRKKTWGESEMTSKTLWRRCWCHLHLTSDLCGFQWMNLEMLCVHGSDSGFLLWSTNLITETRFSAHTELKSDYRRDSSVFPASHI